MPRMISQIGLVSLRSALSIMLAAARNAGAGRMMASMKAHASTMNAATASAMKK